MLFSINICIVKGKETSGFRIVSELCRGGWMIDEQYVQSIMPYIQSLLSASQPMAIAQGEDTLNEFLGIENGVAHLSIKDAIMTSDYCGSLGSNSIAEIINNLNNNPKVEGLVLHLNSPGGAMHAGAQITDALKAFEKPKASFVQGYAASAGYWIAANTDKIFLANKFSQLGSIGVMINLVDKSESDKKYGYKVISIYAPESSEKNLAYREAIAGNEKPMQDELSKSAKLFIGDLEASRPGIKDSAKKGAMYYSSEAIEMGLGDSIGSLNDAIAFVKGSNKEVKLYI